MGTGLILWAWLWIVGFAHGEEGVPWYVGRMVTQVNLEATFGGLPDENLEPLLRTRAGEPLDPGTLRADLVLLMQAGGFASVDVLVEPWSEFREDGIEIEAVRVAFRVEVAPRIAWIDIEGVRGPTRRLAERSLGLHRGDPVFRGDDPGEAAEGVEAALRRAGWEDAEVAIIVELEEDRRLRLRVLVEPGTPRRIGRVRIAGDVPVPERWIRRWLRKEGIARGRILDVRVQEAGRLRIFDELAAMGWDRALVSLVTSGGAQPGDEVQMSVLIAQGPRLLIKTRGRGLANDRVVRDVLGLRAGDRITENMGGDAAERLDAWFSEHGYRDAEVTINVEYDDPDQTVGVRVKRGPRHWLKRIRWDGGDAVPRTDRMVTIREAAPDTLAIGLVTEDGLGEIEAAITDRYRAEGHLDVEVRITDTPLSRGLVRLPARVGVPVFVDVAIVQGPQTLLSGIRVVGGLGYEAEVLEEWLVAHVGAHFDAAAVDALEQSIINTYEDRGYLSVETTVTVNRDSIQNTAEAIIRLDAGEQVRLRSVVIRGNQRTRPKVIVREIALEVGEPVTPRRIAQTRSGLYDLELFQLVSPDLVGDDPHARDLLLRVEERQNILLEAGGGVSTDQGIRTTGRATHRNLAGLGHRLSFLGSVGYGWFGDEWRLDTATPVWTAATRYEIPYVPGRGGRLIVDGLINEMVQEPTWRLSRSGGGLGMKMRLSNRSHAVIGYRIQRRTLVDVDPGALVNGDPWLPELGLDTSLSGDPVLTSAPRIVSGGSLLFVRDNRDDRFDPRSGSAMSTELEVGDGMFSGQVSMRASSKLERLVPLGPLVLDLVWRGGIGWAEGRASTLPLEERFYLGGGSTLRGFRLNSVGPANFAARPEIDFPSQIEPVTDGLTLPNEPAHWVATGGDGMAAVTAEIRIPLPLLGFQRMEGTWVVLFTDAGHVGFIDPSIVTTSRLEGNTPLVRASLGAGLRIATPIGPASFDVGFNTNPLLDRDEPWVLPHLSLGVL